MGARLKSYNFPACFLLPFLSGNPSFECDCEEGYLDFGETDAARGSKPCHGLNATIYGRKPNLMDVVVRFTVIMPFHIFKKLVGSQSISLEPRRVKVAALNFYFDWGTQGQRAADAFLLPHS